ncbi:MAG: ArsC/Spx/MgsR family protein [Bacteroidota bacterium]
MTRLFHLANCTTCQAIIKQWQPGPEIEMQDIKTEPMTEEQIDEMARLAGSYEAIFSRRAMKYRAWGLNSMELTEADYRSYILKEYTFLKRPVLVLEDKIFVGNTKKVVAAAKEALLNR